jgi:hypothetical protein
MRYLTPGEAYLASKPMESDIYIDELNAETRDSRLKKTDMPPEVDRYLEIREAGHKSLTELGLTRKKQLCRGISRTDEKTDLLNPDQKSPLSLNELLENLVGKNKNLSVIEFAGGSYPFSSDKSTAEHFSSLDSHGVIFQIRTDKGIDGQVLSPHLEHEWTVTPHLSRAKIKSVAIDDMGRHIVKLSEVEKTVEPNHYFKLDFS